METGRVKFLKFIAGLMIMVKMEENLFRKQNRLVQMKQKNIKLPESFARGDL